MVMPHPGWARIRRSLLKRGSSAPSFTHTYRYLIHLGIVHGEVDYPVATTYGLPIYNYETGYHVPNPDRNEFADNPELMKFLCCNKE